VNGGYMTATVYAQAITSVFTSLSKILDKFPDYDQKQKKEFDELVERYRTESTRMDDIDHDLILNLYDKITDQLKNIDRFLQKKSEEK